MAWIKSHQEIGRHPKTKRLARALDISIPAAVGHLHLLWHWCLDYAQDGDLSSHDAEEIADAMMWEGEPGVLIQALAEAQWIDTDFNAWMEVHDWKDYGGDLLEKRRANAQRMKEARANRVQRTCNARSNHVPMMNGTRAGAREE